MKRLGVPLPGGALALPACTLGPEDTRPVVNPQDLQYQTLVQGGAEGSVHAQTRWTVLEDRMLDELDPDARDSDTDRSLGAGLGREISEEAGEEQPFSIPPSEG